MLNGTADIVLQVRRVRRDRCIPPVQVAGAGTCVQIQKLLLVEQAVDSSKDIFAEYPFPEDSLHGTAFFKLNPEDMVVIYAI